MVEELNGEIEGMCLRCKISILGGRYVDWR